MEDLLAVCVLEDAAGFDLEEMMEVTLLVDFLFPMVLGLHRVMAGAAQSMILVPNILTNNQSATLIDCNFFARASFLR